ncbi:protein IcmD (DotP) [Legionella lansingensis]|uniref:Protein IcmD (DotP) n=2 Tax=Legionella lansingensis TaxID=45067 RepID=A0A0W0VGR1_9GAMM|nr:protein IcmD (DotP) [Legionella lansingensis]SNV53010.1 protein IcmD (DotP) [Legionella lansingensis]
MNAPLKHNLKQLLLFTAYLGLMVFAGEVAASGKTLGNMASSITGSFTSIAKLITAGSYLAGLGFSIGAIMKFKQHKDNPTQIPIGTPIALVFIAAALLFLPSILGVAGQTMFGETGSVAGPSGTIFGTS